MLTGLCKGAFPLAEGRQRLLDTVKLLLDAGADPFLGDEFNTNPLHYAMQGAGMSRDSRMVELLFDAMYPIGPTRGKVRTS
jgi:ankyrin repeat protein